MDNYRLQTQRSNQYEGRYYICGTHTPIQEARRVDLTHYCFMNDEKTTDYLPHLVGSNNYVIAKNAEK